MSGRECIERGSRLILVFEPSERNDQGLCCVATGVRIRLRSIINMYRRQPLLAPRHGRHLVRFFFFSPLSLKKGKGGGWWALGGDDWLGS